MRIINSLASSFKVSFLFLILLFSCDPPYPEIEPWYEVCEFFPPRVAHYRLTFTVNETTGIGLTRVPDALIICKVVKHERLPHPIIQDSCYWSMHIDTIFTERADEMGFLSTNFDFSYHSMSDYFVLEISSEKDGFYPVLASLDRRWYYYGDDWLAGWHLSLPEWRQLSPGITMKPRNDNP